MAVGTFIDNEIVEYDDSMKKYNIILDLNLVVQEHLKAELAAAKENEDEFLRAIEKEVKDNLVTKYKLEGQLETLIVAYDTEMSVLQKVYDQMLRKYDDGKLQLETYRHKIVALRLENEKILAEEKAEKEQQKALEAKEAAITEASQLIATYAHAFLTRRAAAIKSKSKGRR
ncbi:unnamed protein product [Hymenolepis diminuta]|uniref:Dynein regulatory complex protein 10 n=1 Tax=Hymenolepis diminuta TaxID=6216 RepID=A0A158QBZ3_HYMDI|nr:unnamed protein product [Hymenolepis diminuta]